MKSVCFPHPHYVYCVSSHTSTHVIIRMLFVTIHQPFDVQPTHTSFNFGSLILPVGQSDKVQMIWVIVACAFRLALSLSTLAT